MAKKEITAPAGIIKRAAAFLIDLLIIDIVIGAPFTSLIDRFAPKNPMELFEKSSPALVEIGIIISLISILYFAILEYRIGQTVGKILMNIYVEPIRKEKRFWSYLARSLFMIPIIPFAFFWIIDPIYMIFDKEQRRLLEVISGTKTVMKVSI